MDHWIVHTLYALLLYTELRVMNLSVSSGRIEGIKQGSNRITLPALGNGGIVKNFADLGNNLFT